MFSNSSINHYISEPINTWGMLMKKYQVIFAFLFAFILNNCNSDNGNDPINGKSYPASVNFEWEYNTTANIDYYDSSGGIDSTQTIDLGNTIVRITGVNQSLNGYSDLIKFVSFDVSSPYSTTDWYENKADGFYSVAYQTAGAAQPVMPKYTSGRRYYNLNDLKRIFTTPGFNLFLNKVTDDSIRFYDSPRKVLAYPIQIGNSWNELKTPFMRDRIITTQKNITVNGTNYNTYKIESIWDMPHTEFTDYVSMTSGLVMREISADSLLVSTVDNPDGNGQFEKYRSVSRLVRKNF